MMHSYYIHTHVYCIAKAAAVDDDFCLYRYSVLVCSEGKEEERHFVWYIHPILYMMMMRDVYIYIYVLLCDVFV